MKITLLKSTHGKEDLDFGIKVHKGHFGISFYIQLVLIEFICVAPIPKYPRNLMISFKIPFIWNGYYFVIQIKR